MEIEGCKDFVGATILGDGLITLLDAGAMIWEEYYVYTNLTLCNWTS